MKRKSEKIVKQVNITEHNKTEEELKQSEEKYRKLYEELKEVNKELRELIIIDPHTELYNFRYFEEVVEKEFEYAKRYSHSLSLVMIDIDYFKSINDVYDHQFGDLVLKQLAKQLKGNVRRYDTVIRFGGEEFVIIFPGVDRAEALNLSNKILSTVNSYNFGNEEHSVRLRLSMGITSYPEDRVTKATDLLDFADQILHKVKEDGGNRVYSSNNIKIRKTPISEDEKKVKSLKEMLDEITRRANQTLIKTISAFIKTIDIESVYTVEHSEKVSKYAVKISKILDLSENEIGLIEEASLLHDIGKIGISRKILFKNGKLTEEEYERVKKHPEIAVDIIRSIRNLHSVIPIILHHHERWNGKGYPDGLKGEDIPLEA